MKKGKYAAVIIDISHENVDRPFTYLIPEEIHGKIEIGDTVIVPFGSGNRLRKGIVVDFPVKSEWPDDRLKFITELSSKDVSLSDSRIELAAWMKRNYGSTMIASLKTVIPVRKKVKESTKKIIVRNKTIDEIDEYIQLAMKRKNAAQLRLLFAIREEERIPKDILDRKFPVPSTTLAKLRELGFITIEEERVIRKTVKADRREGENVKLSPKQQQIVDEIAKDREQGINKTYLLHGITGSGKTEVYLDTIEKVIERGEQAIVLIPEIALTYQTLMRFYRRFKDRVGIMNSTLSDGEKYDLFTEAKEGNLDVVIGPRSALFTPFQNLGIIVIDEEHEGTYKSENMPKYHARETAIELAKMSGASVLLGSATPSIDSYYKALNGEYRLFSLTERLTGNQLPTVHVADLRQELRSGNKSILSRQLQELITDRLSKKEQIMLFLNRRGVAGFVSCRACGFVVKCKHCDVSLTLHNNGRMVCHYCGYSQEAYRLCPSCGSKYIMGFKAGTEQVEETVQKMYPGVRTLRMDADTTKKREDYESILSKFLDHEADVLIGTQMIVKGHDFKNVTLVGVIAADMSLFVSDYKAPEKTFQLLTQAAGRAGRGLVPGDVVIQTYQPEHYAIQFALNQDYEGFYREEIGYRDLMDYPPVAHMLSVLVTDPVSENAEKLSAELVNLIRKNHDSLVIGPTPCAIARVNEIYRYSFYIKNKDYDKLVEIKDMVEEYLLSRKRGRELVFFDFDPQNMM